MNKQANGFFAFILVMVSIGLTGHVGRVCGCPSATTEDPRKTLNEQSISSSYSTDNHYITTVTILSVAKVNKIKDAKIHNPRMSYHIEVFKL